MNNTIVLTGNQIKMARALTLRAALKLEIIGLKRSRGPSAYAIIKSEFNLKGNKERVLDQLNQILEKE